MDNKKSIRIMGVDIGTTAVKVVVMDENLAIISKSSRNYPIYSPKPDWAEQDPEEIISAVYAAIKESVLISGLSSPGDISAVSLCSAMHSVICVDRYGTPLTKAIIWADNRAGSYINKLRNEYEGHGIYMRTGTPIHPMSPLLKIMWIKDNMPDVFQKTAKFIALKEYLFWKLFNRYCVDYSVASATGLFNLKNLDWDEGALSAAGITRDRLSIPVPTTGIYTGISGAGATATGLHAGTKFVIGASDGPLSNIGVGAASKGEVALTIGTSGAVRTIIGEPVTDEAERTFCYSLTEKHWVIGGPVNNGGIVFQWIRDQLCRSEIEDGINTSTDPYDIIHAKLKSIPPGSDGLLFHPYMSGERAPLWNPDARGSFIGLTLNHTREHMINAALEGIMYNLNDVTEVLENFIGNISVLKASGGFVRSERWLRITADMFGKTVTIPDSYESSCIGAGILAIYALGIVSDLEQISHQIKEAGFVKPDPDNISVYRQLIPIYRKTVHALTSAGVYTELSDYQRNCFKSGRSADG